MKGSGKFLLGIALAAVLFGTVLLAARTVVKEPAVAGSFYPADREELHRFITGVLSRASASSVEGRLIALVVPHAGYVYSGQVAAHAYRHITERPVDTVILIGASHAASYAGVSVYSEGLWRTPLGDVKINERIAKALLSTDSGVVFAPEHFAREHSLEVQAPFLQETLREFTIVPVLMGAPARGSFSHLVSALTDILRKNDKAIIVASTDLSHYHDHATAVQKDRKVLDAVRRMSVEDLQALLESGEGEACGGHPLLLTMMVARNLGATNGVLYSSLNSGDVTGDRSRVVGYGSLGLYQSPLAPAQRQELLALARRMIRLSVKGAKAPAAASQDPRLRANGATFVTINRRGMLRGCIGNIQPVMPLDESVAQNAVSASSRDPRFPPMTAAELGDMEVEVTVLSPLEPLANTRDITIGVHGLYLIKGDRGGVFLPQVPVEQRWDLTTYLEQLSLKAGLPKDAWKDRETRLFRFSADIIREH